ncbi:YezD family protein [Ammoniphilus sp. YIM 78166]|uniref:YezD family protein n=1 Tax=Ammoniphilus sp. YIM 78166 TaxID=1644106 RepID=UPI0010705789|nr:YezD family protein [Ammoniphilus sp. YIM 78166]
MEENSLSKRNIDEALVEKIIRSLEGLEYGSVHITVHDSNITQIERVEKQRFPVEKKVLKKEV